MKQLKFGLRVVGEQNLIGFSVTSNNDGHDCGELTYKLDITSNQIWLVDNPRIAEYVRTFSTPWYNSDYKCPVNPYLKLELEVVEYKIETTPIETSIPSFRDMMLWLDEIGKEHGHARFIDNPQFDQTYSIYDLESWIRHHGTPKN